MAGRPPCFAWCRQVRGIGGLFFNFPEVLAARAPVRKAKSLSAILSPPARPAPASAEAVVVATKNPSQSKLIQVNPGWDPYRSRQRSRPPTSHKPLPIRPIAHYCVYFPCFVVQFPIQPNPTQSRLGHPNLPGPAIVGSAPI